MIVRSLADVAGTDRDVTGDGWHSLRLLLRNDRMGFSLHETTVAAGSELELEYRHHLEACYCVEGEGELLDHADGQRYPILPGTVYALDEHDRHRLTVQRDLRLVCVFNPALAGTERHTSGGYEPSPD